jgi:hypothetical protein
MNNQDWSKAKVLRKIELFIICALEAIFLDHSVLQCKIMFHSVLDFSIIYKSALWYTL